jgi:hypothetical protein
MYTFAENEPETVVPGVRSGSDGATVNVSISGIRSMPTPEEVQAISMQLSSAMALVN